MIITLEHEDIENALLAWMNDKGMTANEDTTKISMTKARNTGRITAVIDPNGLTEPRATTAVAVDSSEPPKEAVDDASGEEHSLFKA